MISKNINWKLLGIILGIVVAITISVISSIQDEDITADFGKGWLLLIGFALGIGIAYIIIKTELLPKVLSIIIGVATGIMVIVGVIFLAQTDFAFIFGIFLAAIIAVVIIYVFITSLMEDQNKNRRK